MRALMMTVVAVIGLVCGAWDPVQADLDDDDWPMVNIDLETAGKICPSGWYPESYDAARAGDPDRCVPFDPCFYDADGTSLTLWYGMSCNPFISEPDEIVFVLNVNDEWVPVPGPPADQSWTVPDFMLDVGPLVEPPIVR